MLDILNKLLSFGSSIILALDIIVLYFIFSKKENALISFIKNKSLFLIFVISGLASIASLFYSDVIGYTPCTLCWWQRVGIFGTFVISSVALIKNNKSAISSIQALSVFGILFSVYHNYIYYTGNSPLPCDVSASCTQRFVFEFGFMTIPLMAFTTLLTFIIIGYLGEKNNTDKNTIK